MRRQSFLIASLAFVIFSYCGADSSASSLSKSNIGANKFAIGGAYSQNSQKPVMLTKMSSATDLRAFLTSKPQDAKEDVPSYLKVAESFEKNPSELVNHIMEYLTEIENICTLSENIGLKKLDISSENEEFYEIDISWPNIKKLAENAHLNTDVFNAVKDITCREDDLSRTHISDDQIRRIKELCIGKELLFDNSELGDWQKELFDKAFEKVVKNYTGFQKFASFLTISELVKEGKYNSRMEDRGFEDISRKYSLKLRDSGKDGGDYFIRSDYAVKMQFSDVLIADDGHDHSKSIANRVFDGVLYNLPSGVKPGDTVYLRVSVDRLAESFLHEFSHAFHFKVGVTNFSYNLNLLFNHTISSVKSIDFLSLYYPFLGNDIEDRIRNIVEYINSDSVLKKLKPEQCEFVFDEIMKSGFGYFVFKKNPPWNVSELLSSEEVFARALYVTVFQRAGYLDSWTKLSEVINIVGILPIRIGKKIFVIHDRNAEIQYKKRERPPKEDGYKSEDELSSYRYHQVLSYNASFGADNNSMNDNVGYQVWKLLVELGFFGEDDFYVDNPFFKVCYEQIAERTLKVAYPKKMLQVEKGNLEEIPGTYVNAGEVHDNIVKFLEEFEAKVFSEYGTVFKRFVEEKGTTARDIIRLIHEINIEYPNKFSEKDYSGLITENELILDALKEISKIPEIVDEDKDNEILTLMKKMKSVTNEDLKGTAYVTVEWLRSKSKSHANSVETLASLYRKKEIIGDDYTLIAWDKVTGNVINELIDAFKNNREVLERILKNVSFKQFKWAQLEAFLRKVDEIEPDLLKKADPTSFDDWKGVNKTTFLSRFPENEYSDRLRKWFERLNAM